MFLNGAPVRSLGKIGEVVNVRDADWIRFVADYRDKSVAAYEAALANGSTGPILNELFRRALRFGRRVRTLGGHTAKVMVVVNNQHVRGRGGAP